MGSEGGEKDIEFSEVNIMFSGVPAEVWGGEAECNTVRNMRIQTCASKRNISSRASKGTAAHLAHAPEATPKRS